MRTQVGVYTTVLAGLPVRWPAGMPGVGVWNRDGNQHHRAWQQWRDEAVGSDRNQWAFPVFDAGLWEGLCGPERRFGAPRVGSARQAV